MSTSHPTGYYAQYSVPAQLRRRRTPTACLNCRRQKIKCRRPDESARQPCERCALRGLVCQYVSATAHKEELDLIHETTAAATSSNAQGSSSAPGLPHTGPPPLNQLPRYFGQSLPDLSLSSNYGAQPTASPSGPNLRSTDSRFSPSLLAAWVTPLGPMAGHPSANQGDLLVTSSSAANQRSNFTDYQDPFNRPYSGQDYAAYRTTHGPPDHPQGHLLGPTDLTSGSQTSQAERDGRRRS